MRNRLSSVRAHGALALLLLSPLSFVPAAHATENGNTSYLEAYQGTVAGLTHRLPRLMSSSIKVRINRFSTEDETQTISSLLEKKTPEALQNWLGDRLLGTVQIGETLPQPIAAAWSFEDDAGRHLVIVVPRPISIREVFQNRRSVDYPYTVAQLDLEADGHGSGELNAAARLRVAIDGSIEFNPLGVIPLRILNLRPLEG